MSGETKFTSGPWVARKRWVGTPNHASAIAECRSAVGTWENDAKAMANAALIAAAPALYAAAVSTLQRLEEDPEQKDGFAARMLRSAIAQADGRER